MSGLDQATDGRTVKIVAQVAAAKYIRKLQKNWKNWEFPEDCAPPPEPNCITDGGTTLFFGGDTKYHHGFPDIGRRFRIDVAMLPVGGSLVLGRRIVMTPAQALQAAVELGCRTVIPIGTSIKPVFTTFPTSERLWCRCCPRCRF